MSNFQHDRYHNKVRLSDDCVAYVMVQYLSDGSLRTSGHIGDKKLAMALLNNAKEAISRLSRPEESGLVVPAMDVEAMQHPSYPVKPVGDMW